METLFLFIWQLFFGVTTVYAIALTKVVQAPKSNSIAGVNPEMTPSSNARVNISNVWTLPEEGYPVFYRYFRDRVTWFEADAVCQFHHAQLVTVDSNVQFDAVRAFLKELDVSNLVWIGLKQSKPSGEFLWTDFRPLTNQEHWQDSLPQSEASVCVASDPAADFRWRDLCCGGPAVSSFICEIPVPDWARKEDGCLLTALPSLTVTYLPEQSAVELITDCGLDGGRRVMCQGHTSRDAIMKELSCEGITESPADNGITWSNEMQTRHRRDTVQPSETTTTISSLRETVAAKQSTDIPVKVQVPEFTMLSGESTGEDKDGSEVPQEMSMAEEPIKLRTQIIKSSPSFAEDHFQIKADKSIELDSGNVNSVQNTNGSFTVSNTIISSFASHGESALTSDESMEEMRSLKIGPQSLVPNSTVPTPSTTEKILAPAVKRALPVIPTRPSNTKPTEKTEPSKKVDKKDGLKATTAPSTKGAAGKITSSPMTTVTPTMKTTSANAATTGGGRTSTKTLHLRDSDEMHGEITSKKVKKTISNAMTNNFDELSTVSPKQNVVLTTSTRFISKNLPPVLLYNKNENEQREIEQVLTPRVSGFQYSTSSEEVLGDKSKSKEVKPVVSEDEHKVKSNSSGAAHVSDPREKLTTEKAQIPRSTGVTKPEISTPLIASTSSEVTQTSKTAAETPTTSGPITTSKSIATSTIKTISETHQTTTLKTKSVTSAAKSETARITSPTSTIHSVIMGDVKTTPKVTEITSQPSTERIITEATSTMKLVHHDFLESNDPDIPERPNRGRLLSHSSLQHHTFYPYFLNRVLG